MYKKNNDRRDRKNFSTNKNGRYTPRNTGNAPYHTTSNNQRGRHRPTSYRGHNMPHKRKMPVFDPTNFINKNPREEKTEAPYKATHSFTSFGLHESLVEPLKERGITIPTPIQDQIIPHILSGRDVIGLAETGTGKTAAFLLPLIEKTLSNQKRRTLVLTPTRELAVQIERELRDLAKKHRIFSTLCVGGVGIMPQMRALKRHNHFIIGTPGRIIDLINRGSFKTSELTTVVLDEADRMLDMGFIHDMRNILSKTPKNRETLLFSATMSPATQDISKDFLRDPVVISVKKRDVTDSIVQDIVPYNDKNKYEVLISLLDQPNMSRVIVFGAMKHSVDRLAKQLCVSGVEAESIQGNKSHGQRQRALARFKSGEARVLVATDVAARGIHVDDVSHVINYDLPTSFEDYVHRIGRTGRGEKRGMALTFVPKNR